MKVLIIDDDKPWAEIAAALLRSVTTRVLVATTWAEAAMTIAKPNGFDVVIVDLNLPDSPADVTLRRIRDIIHTGRKVVVMTGADVSEFIRSAAKGSGALECYYKGDINFADKISALCSEQA